jgi:hypothetical protein
MPQKRKSAKADVNLLKARAQVAAIQTKALTNRKK